MTSRAQATSEGLFNLLDDVGINLREDAPIEPDVYHAFRDRYLAWAAERDAALGAHLAEAPNAFRCALKYTDRVFATAYQVLWYFDEIVVPDPISRALSTDDASPNSLALVKRRLLILAKFRQSIECGYMLLAGPGLIPLVPKEVPTEVATFSQRPEVEAALEPAIRLGLAVRTASDGSPSAVFDARGDTAFVIAFNIPARGEQDPDTVTTAGYVVGEDLPEASIDDIAHAFRDTPEAIRQQLRRLYAVETFGTLHNVAAAAQLRSCALLDRRADQDLVALARERGGTPSASHEALSLALPYLDGVPPDRLYELRAAIPEAFTEFRARVADIVERAIEDSGSDFHARARSIAERELVPSLRHLDTEMKAAAKKARVLGYVPPVIASIGAFIGEYIYNVPGSVIFGAVLASLGAPVTAAAQYAADAKNATKNPFYFVWRARSK